MADSSHNVGANNKPFTCFIKHNIVNGVIVPHFIRQERVDELKILPLRSDDLFIATFPKSGTTWTRQIVKLILNNGEDDERQLLGDHDIAIPWLAGHSGSQITDIDAIPAPRAFFDHMPYGMMPGGPPNSTPSKYLYVARNPKDVLVSLYYHCISGKNHLGFSGVWDDLFRAFINGETFFGSWFDHVLEWWKHKDDLNVLFLKYEDMNRDPPGAVRTIAEFLDCNIQPNVVDKIVEQSSLDRMNHSTSLCTSTSSIRSRYDLDEINPFVRKGIVGDWKNHFTAEQSAEFDALFEEKMKGTGLKFEFGDCK